MDHRAVTSAAALKMLKNRIIRCDLAGACSILEATCTIQFLWQSTPLTFFIGIKSAALSTDTKAPSTSLACTPMAKCCSLVVSALFQHIHMSDIGVGADGRIIVWSTMSGDMQQEILDAFHGSITAVCWLDFDDKKDDGFAYGCVNGTIHVYRFSPERVSRLFYMRHVIEGSAGAVCLRFDRRRTQWKDGSRHSVQWPTPPYCYHR